MYNAVMVQHQSLEILHRLNRHVQITGTVPDAFCKALCQTHAKKPLQALPDAFSAEGRELAYQHQQARASMLAFTPLAFEQSTLLADSAKMASQKLPLRLQYSTYAPLFQSTQ